VLATMLAYVAHDAARSHRATAERALHDYAAVAAWEFVAGVGDEIRAGAGPALAPIRARAISPYELLPAPTAIIGGAAGALRCPAGAGDTARSYFRFDFRDRSFTAIGSPLSPTMRDWLTDTIAAHGSGIYQPDWTHAVVVGAPRGERPTAIVYAVKYAEHRAPIAAYGFTTCPAALGAPLYRAVLDRRTLLPTALASGVPNDSLVVVAVIGDSGRVVFESQHAALSPYFAAAPLEQPGTLTARATIRPRAVELLALGAIPQSRVPLLAGLLALMAAMVGVAVLQLRREHELSRLRADFISSVSHELRTPLSQILLFAETLNLGRVRSEGERGAAAEVIVQEGRRLMHLVENILHFSRTERRMTRLGVEPVELAPAVQATVEDWIPLAGAADVRITTHLDHGVIAVADRSALRQMLLNLLDNAVKYGSPSRDVSVGVESVKGRARIWVEDRGDGIPPRERERVWESFYRLDRHANSAVAGSGIGLYVVRELARLHAGDAWIEDARGGAEAERRGIRVVIELPIAERAEGFTEEHAAVETAR